MNAISPAAGLAMRDVRASFGATAVLHGVTLGVAPGETLVLFGPSGAGKTVLLRAISGLDPNSTGQVQVGGRDVSVLGPERRGFGVAFQNFALYPHMSARRNIASPLQAQRLPGAEINARVDRIATLLKISHVLEQPPRALSNGQKQRTSLARALVGEPKVLLLDDPLRNVDAKLRYEMRLELPRLLRRYNAAAIYVTQDYREAMALGDRVAVLIAGHVVQVDGPEQVYDAPASTAVARLFGDPPLNLVPCRPSQGNDGVRVQALGLDLGLPLSPELAGRDALLGMRPEDIQLSGDPAPGWAPAPGAAAPRPASAPRHAQPGPLFEPVRPLPEGARPRAKVLAFYLPQFHPVPENDAWWGEGFTEWTNVARGLPRFAGHYQPRTPRDLGHYRLEGTATMRRQAELARGAGVHGVVRYFYWVNGRRLLSGPTEAMLADPGVALPFCLMWANENWTRRWDGGEDDVLISQDYRPEDEAPLVDELARHMRDPRYIRVGGRPLLMVYRAGLVRGGAAAVARWRRRFRDAHGEDPLLVMAQSFDERDPGRPGVHRPRLRLRRRGTGVARRAAAGLPAHQDRRAGLG